MKRRRAGGLFDTPPVERPAWHGRHDLEPLPRHLCPHCQGPLHIGAGGDQPALFYMHGHGYITRTTWATCPCGYRRHHTTSSHNPRR